MLIKPYITALIKRDASVEVMTKLIEEGVNKVITCSPTLKMIFKEKSSLDTKMLCVALEKLKVTATHSDNFKLFLKSIVNDITSKFEKTIEKDRKISRSRVDNCEWLRLLPNDTIYLVLPTKFSDLQKVINDKKNIHG